MSSLPVSFRELMTLTAETVGFHHLPVRDRADDINEFLEEGAVHHTLIRRIVRSVYRASRCCHLDAPVRQSSTLETLGTIRGELIRSEDTDIDQLHLVDAVGTAVLTTFLEIGTRHPRRPTREDSAHDDRTGGVTPTTRYCLVSEA